MISWRDDALSRGSTTSDVVLIQSKVSSAGGPERPDPRLDAKRGVTMR